MGWAVDPPPLPPPRTIVPVIDGEALVVDGMRLRFVDEPDVGDLYNFCPQPGATVSEPSDVRTGGSDVTLTFERDLRIGAAAARQPPLGCNIASSRNNPTLRSIAR